MSASFCDDCGSILPLPSSTANISCAVCHVEVDMSGRVDTKVTYVVRFNQLDEYTRGREQTGSAAQPAGPLAEKVCPRCGNPEMTYATAQLRSADEGQTIFYTCPKCSYKFSENS